jgi:hypothetical protein
MLFFLDCVFFIPGALEDMHDDGAKWPCIHFMTAGKNQEG